MSSNKSDTYVLISQDKFNRLMQSQQSTHPSVKDLPTYHHSDKQGFVRSTTLQESTPISEGDRSKTPHLVYRPPPGSPSIDDSGEWDANDNGLIGSKNAGALHKRDAGSGGGHNDIKQSWGGQWQKSVFSK